MGSATAALYRSPPQDFVAARDEEVRRLRAEGAADAAREVARLRRPTVGAWLVNLLVAEEPALPEQLTELAHQLRTAQAELSGDDLRALGRQRQQLVAGLLARSRELARAAGRPVSDDALVEVESSLRAALADPAVATEVLSGRLLHAADFSGFGTAGAATAQLAPAGAARARPSAAGKAEPGKKQRGRAQRARAERALREAEQELAAAESEHATADRAAERAGAALSSAEDQLTRLHQQLKQAQDELDAARRANREARSRARAAASVVTRARQRVERARRAVD